MTNRSPHPPIRPPICVDVRFLTDSQKEDRLRRKTQLIQLSQGVKNPPLDRVPPFYGQMFTGSASEVSLHLRSRESVLNWSSTDQKIRVESGGGLPLKHRGVPSLHVATANTYILYIITAVAAGAAVRSAATLFRLQPQAAPPPPGQAFPTTKHFPFSSSYHPIGHTHTHTHQHRLK